MSEVVSFRAEEEDVALIERTRRQLGLATRADAIRHLLREGGAKRVKFSETPLGRFRIPAKHRRGQTWSSDDIDALLYDDAGSGR